MTHIWLRSEQRNLEKRVGLTPEGVKDLLKNGFKVTVEESPDRIIPIKDYAETGCDIVHADSWETSPHNTIILGLKELDIKGPDLVHKHIMFGHAYKGQADGPKLLARFARGNGCLLDLEYLTDEAKNRVVAFGYWAGFAGAAVGIMTWLAQQSLAQNLPASIMPYSNKKELIDRLKKELEMVLEDRPAPTSLIIGGMGRVGTGASDLLKSLGLKSIKWDREETSYGGPFPKILEHEIFINCILATSKTPIFINMALLSSRRRLSVIADISCDPSSEFNPVPIYDKASSFSTPVFRIIMEPILDVMAIDNLPSMLPLESSLDFSQQLLPYLRCLDKIDQGVWGRANDIFRRHI